jgi:hypothetical protein
VQEPSLVAVRRALAIGRVQPQSAAHSSPEEAQPLLQRGHDVPGSIEDLFSALRAEAAVLGSDPDDVAEQHAMREMDTYRAQPDSDETGSLLTPEEMRVLRKAIAKIESEAPANGSRRCEP